MIRAALIFLAALTAQSALADIVVPVRTIRPKTILTGGDLTFKAADIEGVVSDPMDLIGQEARVALYAGRPITYADFGPPAIVERNDLVTLRFNRGVLVIATEGRSLGRGSEGETIRVMNLSSRTTVSGRIRADGSIEVK